MKGRIGRHSYTEASLRDPEILALTDKVHYVVDPSLPGPAQFKGVVRVELIDGTMLEEIEEYNRGSPKNPMTEGEIIGKFRENVEGTLSDEAATRIAEAVLSLESIEDARTLSALTAARHD